MHAYAEMLVPNLNVEQKSRGKGGKCVDKYQHSVIDLANLLRNGCFRLLKGHWVIQASTFYGNQEENKNAKNL